MTPRVLLWFLKFLGLCCSTNFVGLAQSRGSLSNTVCHWKNWNGYEKSILSVWRCLGGRSKPQIRRCWDPGPRPVSRLGGCHSLITEAPAICILIYHHRLVMSAVIYRTDQQTKVSFLSFGCYHSFAALTGYPWAQCLTSRTLTKLWNSYTRDPT